MSKFLNRSSVNNSKEAEYDPLYNDKTLDQPNFALDSTYNVQPANRSTSVAAFAR